MLYQILKINIRNLFKDRNYSLINILGLTLGMTACMLISLWVKDELTFDNFHEKGDQIYRVITEEKGEGGLLWTAPATPHPLAPALEAEIPELQQTVRVLENYGRNLYEVDGKAFEQRAVYLEPEFFEVFDYKVLAGDPKIFLDSPNKVVLSASMATSLFGDLNPLGQNLILEDSIPLIVSGLIEDMPSNSSFDFQIMLPLQLIEHFRPEDKTSWGNWNYTTFLVLNETIDPTIIDEKITAVYQTKSGEASTRVFIQPLEDIHLYSNFREVDRGSSQLTSIYYLLGIGLLILIIAGINYTNLSIARASKQTKAVSIRKIVGASRQNLFSLFLGESVLLTGISLILAIGLLEFVFPSFNVMTDKHMVLELGTPGVLGILLGASLLTIFVSGIYPALMVSSFSPIKFLRGSNVLGKSNQFFRRSLLVGQFAISALLIIGTVVIYQQLDFMRSAQLGFEQENIFSFPLSDQMQEMPNTVKEELLRHPDIKQATLTNQLIYHVGSSTDGIEWPGHMEEGTIQINRLRIDKDFYDLFGVELIKGKRLSEQGSENSFLINETAAVAMGMTDPIGQSIRLNRKEGEIVGVIKDFHFQSLRRDINPLILYQSDTYAGQAFIKAETDEMNTVIAAAENVWEKFESSRPFEYHFVDEAYADQYRQEERISNMLSAASLICIIISIIGLMGLVAFAVAQRTREIGIRKVLGATVENILSLLGKDMIRLVLIGIGIAFPIAWYFLGNWLEGFAYRIDLNVLTFLLSGSLVLLLALAVLSIHAFRAATSKPVDALLQE